MIDAMRPLTHRIVRLAAVLVTFAVLPVAASGDSPLDGHWQLVPHVSESVPFDVPEGVVAFVVDDGMSEGSFGVSVAGGAQQFLWFNQFDLDTVGPVRLREISVQFPSGANMVAGAAVQLVVYHDDDGDPTNGASLLATFDETIQAVDGTTFSTYPITPLDIPLGGDLLVGVVSRFVMTGVTGSTQPAAIDTTASQGRSWFAVWTVDPPASPELPPDVLIDNIDTLIPGNWMIRAISEPRVPLEVPAAGTVGLALLASLLAFAALAVLRRN